MLNLGFSVAVTVDSSSSIAFTIPVYPLFLVAHASSEGAYHQKQIIRYLEFGSNSLSRVQYLILLRFALGVPFQEKNMALAVEEELMGKLEAAEEEAASVRLAEVAHLTQKLEAAKKVAADMKAEYNAAVSISHRLTSPPFVYS